MQKYNSFNSTEFFMESSVLRISQCPLETNVYEPLVGKE